MTGFQDLRAWRGRDPYSAGATMRPSVSALKQLGALKGVSPNETPYSDAEMELAFGQQAAGAQSEIQDYMDSTIDPFGHLKRDPTVLRARERAIGGPAWQDFGDQMERSQLMANNRGLGFRANYVGQGPGTGTGIGRWVAQLGRANAGGSFTPTNGPGADLEDLMNDVNNENLPANDRTLAMRALTLLTRGR